MNKTRLWIGLAVLGLLVVAALIYMLNITSTRGETLSQLPLPGTVSNYTKLSEEMITFETDMSMKELLVFYQDMLSKKGYTERTNLTLSSNMEFGLVFDGHTSGKAIIVQGVVLGGTIPSVTLRLRDIGKP